MQGAQRGTRSRDPRVTPWAEGGAKPLSHPGIPKALTLRMFCLLCFEINIVELTFISLKKRIIAQENSNIFHSLPFLLIYVVLA